MILQRNVNFLHIMFLLCLAENTFTTQWIDPHDMNIKVKDKYDKPSLKKSSGTNIKTEEPYCQADICFSHLKRFIGVLINSAHIDKSDPELFQGHIRFTVHPNDLETLKNFGVQDMSLDTLRKVDLILSEGFKRSHINDYLDKLETVQLKLFSIVYNIYNLWLLGAAFMLYIVFQLFKNNFSFAYIFKYLFLIVLVCDFGFRYHYLLEEAENHNMKIEYTAACDTAKMSWTEWISFMTSSRDCERKTATPLDAFLYQIKYLIIVPLQAFGTGMGSFGHEMFTSLPWGLNLIMWPLMLIFVIIIFMFTMAFTTGQTIEFNIFHLIKLKFGGSKHIQFQQDVFTGSTVEKLMEGMLHRPMVQNINVSVASSDNNKNEQNKAILSGATDDTNVLVNAENVSSQANDQNMCLQNETEVNDSVVPEKKNSLETVKQSSASFSDSEEFVRKPDETNVMDEKNTGSNSPPTLDSEYNSNADESFLERLEKILRSPSVDTNECDDPKSTNDTTNASRS